MKTCLNCERMLPKAKFRYIRHRPDNLDSICLTCRSCKTKKPSPEKVVEGEAWLNSVIEKAKQRFDPIKERILFEETLYVPKVTSMSGKVQFGQMKNSLMKNRDEMVYLKIKRADNKKWQFIYDIKEAVVLGHTSEENFDDYGAHITEILNDGKNDPFTVILTNSEDDTRAYSFWATEAYLCDQSSGLTVEYLFRLT